MQCLQQPFGREKESHSTICSLVSGSSSYDWFRYLKCTERFLPPELQAAGPSVGRGSRCDGGKWWRSSRSPEQAGLARKAALWPQGLHTSTYTHRWTHTQVAHTLTHRSDMRWIPTSVGFLDAAELAGPVGGPGVAVDPYQSVDLHTIFSAALQVKEGEVPPRWRVGGRLRANDKEAVVRCNFGTKMDKDKPKCCTFSNKTQ